MDYVASQTDSTTVVDMEAIGRAAKTVARQLAVLPAAVKNRALRASADELEAQAAGSSAQKAIDRLDELGYISERTGRAYARRWGADFVMNSVETL